MKSGGFRGVWLAVVLVALVPILGHVARHRSLPPLYSGEGFAAFYCAGEALRERRDPYALEPLRSCEARTHAVPAGVAEPAPLPPATLGAFALLAGLPFRTASLVWALVLVAALVATGRGLVTLAPRVPPVAIWTALLPGLGFLNGFYGETPALVAAALVWAGVALRRERTFGAVAGVTLAALFEPHVGGAAWLALVLFVPRLRAPLLICAAALAVASVALTGFGTALAYLAEVLPAHARSELGARDQDSLTSLLFQAGVPPAAALRFGALSYLAALALGCGFAPAAARRFRAPELLVFLPAAAVLVGGAFVHDLQMGLALPLAVVAAGHTGRRARPFAYLGLLAGAVPEPWTGLPVLAFGAAAAFAAAWSAGAASGATGWPRSRAARGVIGTIAFALFALAVHATGTAGPAPVAAWSGIRVAPSFGAESNWTNYVWTVSYRTTLGDGLAKFGQAAVLLAIFAAAFGARRAVPAADSNQRRAG